MKEIERRKKVKVTQIDVDSFDSGNIVTTTLESDSLLSTGGYIEVIVKESVPETLIEFREIHGISKLELIDWLNDHYQYKNK